MKQFFTLILLLLFSVGMLRAQVQTIRGTVSTKANPKIGIDTPSPLSFANILIKGTNKGVLSDESGNFEIKADFTGKESLTLVVSYVGCTTEEVVVKTKDAAKTITIQLSMMANGKEVVISSSRISETIMESPVSIQTLNSTALASAPAASFYDGLKNLRGVDISTSSAGFQAINMRGFNTTAPVRVVQFVDGMDNQAPGLNFPIGNMVGANPLDLQNVEVITGPASALYGPNAFQGVVNMISKSPFEHQGIDIELKGGTRNLFEGNLRYAQAFGKKERFAIKITGSYMQMDDWIASDSSANRYGKLSPEVDLSSVVQKLQYDQSLTQEERDRFVALNNYIEFNPLVGERGLNKRVVNAPGYMENQLADNRVKSLKAAAELHYKFNKNITLSYTFKFGLGSAIYQGANRYAIRDIQFQQHKLQLQGRNFLIRAYTTCENAGNSYDIVFTGINTTKASIGDNWVPTYLSNYFSTLDNLTNGFSNDAQIWQVDSATRVATAAANQSFYKPGTAAYDSVKRSIVTNANLQKGSLFVDRSALYHVDGQYQFSFIRFFDLIAGASFRLYTPRSFGTIFSDTLVNRKDTLSNGAADPSAQFVRLTNWEAGGFLQISKKLFKDRFKITASVRVDKNQNFKPQFSPRLALSYTVAKNHTFRIGGQSAFRIPTLQNQFIDLNLGPITLLGNLNGFSNIYTLNSVNAFNDSLKANNNDPNMVDPAVLKSVTYDRLKPEQVRTLEVGYRGLFFDKLFVDADFYYNWYTNFIGDVRVVRPLNGATAGQESGFDAVLTRNYEVYQIPVNASETVRSFGAGIGLSYFINRKITATANYSLNQLVTKGVNSDIIPGFNTPPHKVNVGITGNRVWKGLGFGSSFQWVHGFVWQSPFGTGNVNPYTVWDLQLNYAVDYGNYSTMVKLGSSNLLGIQRREIFGGPQIGRMVYASVTFSWKKPAKNAVKPTKK
jgi:outer membrane receptor protein involved in Fe transport